MRLIFVGSLEAGCPDLARIQDNLSQLVSTILKHQGQLVIRHTQRTDSQLIPVDEMVYQCVEKARNSGVAQISKNDLTVIIESGTAPTFQISVPYVPYTAGAAYRINFYRQILEVVDMVVGVGGRDGLMRHALLCEQIGKPIFFLPGSGGVTDVLWAEYFNKNHQIQYFTKNQIQELRRTPLITAQDQAYGEKLHDLILTVYKVVSRHGRRDDIIPLDGIALQDFGPALKRISIGLWLTVLSIITSLLSLAYYLGTKDIINRLLRMFGIANE